jgi:alcohol dehydrogenase
VELARHRQAHILATVGTAKKEEVVHEAAPDATLIHYRQEDLGGALEREVGDGGLDVILDSVGGRVFRAGWKHLAPGGRYVLFGAAAAVKPGALSRLGAMWRLLPMLAVNPLRMISKNRSLMAFNLLLLADTHLDLLRRGMREILALEVEGDIRPRIGRILSLWDAAEAHERLQSRETTGKLVLRVEEPDEASTSGVVGAPPPPDGGGRAG